MSADLSGKKRRPITAEFQIWEVHFGPWEISRLTLWLQKRTQRSHERWRPYSFRTNCSVNSQAFVLVATLKISLKKITPEVKFAERKSALLQNNNVWKKKSTFCSVLQGNPAVASPKEQLYEQMTSNPAFIKRNIQKANTYLLCSRQEQKIFGHVSLYRACTYVFGLATLWLQRRRLDLR